MRNDLAQYLSGLHLAQVFKQVEVGDDGGVSILGKYLDDLS
jgi:uncharacterized membrane protein